MVGIVLSFITSKGYALHSAKAPGAAVGATLSTRPRAHQGGGLGSVCLLIVCYVVSCKGGKGYHSNASCKWRKLR